MFICIYICYPRAAEGGLRGVRGGGRVTIRVRALLTPPRRLDQGRYKVLGWVQGMSLHVWDEKKLKMLTLTISQKSLDTPVLQGRQRRHDMSGGGMY